MRDSTVFAIGAVVICLFIGIIASGVLALNSYECKAKWSDSPYPITRFSVFGGCQVSKDGKIYLPSTSVREF